MIGSGTCRQGSGTGRHGSGTGRHGSGTADTVRVLAGVADMVRVLAGHGSGTADKVRVLADKVRVLADMHRVLADMHRVLADMHRVLADIHRVLADMHRVSGVGRPLRVSPIGHHSIHKVQGSRVRVWPRVAASWPPGAAAAANPSRPPYFTDTLYTAVQKRAVQFTKKPYLPLFSSETADKFARDYAVKKSVMPCTL